TVGTYADQMGLTANLEGHAYARKLHYQPIPPSETIAMVPGLGYLNIPRSTALMFDAYHSHTAARTRPRGWVDRPSEGIPALYGLMYQGLAQGVKAKDPKLAERGMAIADSIFK